MLWGASDLATLLIDIGHDVRATRVLLGRQVAHTLDPAPTPDAAAPEPYRPTALPRRQPLGDAPERLPEVRPD